MINREKTFLEKVIQPKCHASRLLVIESQIPTAPIRTCD